MTDTGRYRGWGRKPSGAVMLAAVLASITMMGVAIGLTTPLFSIVLDRMGMDASMVGLGMSIQVGATLVVAPLVPWLLARIGAIPVMVSGILFTAVAIFVASALESAWLWFLIRFAIGAGMALHWVVSETWLNRVATDLNRGFIAGLYSALMGVGFAVGPVILGFAGSTGLLPYMIGSIVVLLAGIPLLWVRGAAPVLVQQAGQRMSSVLQIAPVIMFASVVSGFVDNAMLALLPVYGLRAGLSEASAVMQLTVATVGAVVLQLPIGWLGDRLGRRYVLIGCAIIKTAAVLSLPLVIAVPWMLWTILFIWGGVGVAFYTLALALLGETFRGDSLAKASSTLVITYCIGSVIGPLGVGSAMDWMGANGFIAGMALVSALLVVAGLVRIRSSRF